jgi:hypothetical protein
MNDLPNIVIWQCNPWMGMNGVLTRLKLPTTKEKAQVPFSIMFETLTSQGSPVEDSTLKGKLLQSLDLVHTLAFLVSFNNYMMTSNYYFFQKYLDMHFLDLFASPIMTSFFRFPGAYIVFILRMSLYEMTTFRANHFIK